MNDRDRLQDLLAQEKYLTSGYNMALIEASHDALFDVIKQNCDASYQMQRQIFNLMFKKGWYKLPRGRRADGAAHVPAVRAVPDAVPVPPEPADRADGRSDGRSADQPVADRKHDGGGVISAAGF